MGDLYKAHVDKKVLAISALGTYADAQSGVMASFPTPDKSTKDDLLRIEGRIAEMRGRYDAGLNAVYEYKKEERDGLVRTMQSDFDMYIQFFNARKIETELISELHNARTLLKVGSNTQKLLDIVRDIDTMKNEIYPLLARAQVKRDAIRQAEAQERQTKMDELAKAQSTVPEAPIKEGKVIFVSIQTQRLYAYEDGVPIFNYPVPVTTGKRNYNTVTGEYKIYQKHRNFTMRSPFPNDPYVLFVKYWMPFYSGYGLHDAPWRSAFGGPGFLNDGTHGCVNMREHEVAKIYNWASVGTPVIVQ
jgi:lipoprotein-anchoring transpeptidase ErfK/SrfK